MRRFIILLAACAVLFGCKKKTDDPVTLSFECDRIAPMMVRFTNHSVGFDEYIWDFGDGMYSYATDEALHGYESAGTYIVTLTGVIGKQRYDYRQEIAISDPVPYIAGYTLYHIPYTGRYYKLIFKDDSLFPSAWDFQTMYTPMLSDADLPYTIYFASPVPMDDLNSHTYYTVQVIRNTTTSGGNEVQCMKQQLKVKDIKQYREEYILQTETGTTAVGVHMAYDY